MVNPIGGGNGVEAREKSEQHIYHVMLRRMDVTPTGMGAGGQ